MLTPTTAATAAPKTTAAASVVTPTPTPTAAKLDEPSPPKPSGNTPAEVKAVRNAVAALNQSLEQGPTSVRFQIDEDSGKTIITVVDTDKNSVIRQFPTDEALALSRTLPMPQGWIISTKI